MRILLSILFCVFIANAIAPKGAVVTQSVTINSAYVSETSSHFLLQFKVPRTGIVAANCDSAKHVCMTGITDTVRVPRWVVFTTDTLFIYADASKSSSVNTVYNLHFGKALNEVNASATFTNCGVTGAIGADNSSNTGTTLNYATGWSCQVTGDCVFNPAIFSNGVFMNVLGYVSTDIVVPNSGVNDISFVVNQGSFTWARVTMWTGAGAYFQCVTSSQISIGGAIFNFSPMDPSTFYHIRFVQNMTTLATTLYINGVSAGTSTATTGFYGGLTLGRRSGYYGSDATIDNFKIRSSEQSDKISDYNMLFNPSAFLTLGTPALNELTGSRWSAYKSAFKSSYKTAYK